MGGAGRGLQDKTRSRDQALLPYTGSDTRLSHYVHFIDGEHQDGYKCKSDASGSGPLVPKDRASFGLTWSSNEGEHRQCCKDAGWPSPGGPAASAGTLHLLGDTAQSPLPASGVGNQRDREGECNQLGQKGGET